MFCKYCGSKTEGEKDVCEKCAKKFKGEEKSKEVIETNSTEKEDENVQIAQGTKPFKTGIVTKVDDNKLTLSIPVKVNHKANVSDVCLNLQNKIFESISYMTDFKPEAIEIQVTGFIF